MGWSLCRSGCRVSRTMSVFVARAMCGVSWTARLDGAAVVSADAAMKTVVSRGARSVSNETYMMLVLED